jgi:hypothetical protein
MKKNLLKRMGRKIGLFGVGIALMANLGCSEMFYLNNTIYELRWPNLAEKKGQDTLVYRFEDWNNKEVKEVRINGKEISDSLVSKYQSRAINGLRKIDSLRFEEFCKEYNSHNRDTLRNYFDSYKSYFWNE